jgi:nicotinamidase-related amidase
VTTLANRPNRALLVVDLQHGVVGHAHDRDRVVANVQTLVEQARGAGADVIWVQHNDEHVPRGSDAWQLVLERREDEPLVEKGYADAFEDSDLDAVLAERGIGSLIVAGAQTDECIRGTLHGAVARGYDATLVADAHTTEDLSEWGAPPPELVVAHTNLSWGNHRAPGRAAGTVNTSEVTFDAARAR